MLSETTGYPGGDTSVCSNGCRDLHETLGEPATNPETAAPKPTRTDVRATSETGRSSTETVFLRVDGMYSTACEEFLETIGRECNGVVNVAASYVTETARVEYEPTDISEHEVCDALTTLGYTATARGAEAEPELAVGHSTGTSGADREIEDLLGFRYAAGILFSAFLLVPYVVLLYPAHIASLTDGAVFSMFAGMAGLGGEDSLFILPLFLVLTGVVLVFTGMPILRGAYVSLKIRRPTVDLLVSLALLGTYCYSSVAVLAGRTNVYYDLTVVIAATVVAATFYESAVKQRALETLTDLTVSTVTEARVADEASPPDEMADENGVTTDVAVEDLEPGDSVLVREGERVPVDGVLVEDACTVDESVVTGESMPVVKRAGDRLVGGSVVTDGAAVIHADDRATSSMNRLVSTVWGLQSATAGVQRRADRWAAITAPVVVGVALLAGVGSLAFGSDVVTVLLTVLLVPVVGSPWVLGLSTPLSVATSLEEALDRGIVVFDESVFERLRDVDVVVFDKTGTLTTGEMDILEAEAPDPLLEAAGALERRARHPTGAAIADEFAPGPEQNAEPTTDGGSRDSDDGSTDGGTDRTQVTVESFTDHSTGVEGIVDRTRVLVGHPELFDERGWVVPDHVFDRVDRGRSAGAVPIVLGSDGRAEGVVLVGDQPRREWGDTVDQLDELGVDVVVLTGDSASSGETFAEHPGVVHVFAGVPPAGKTAAIRRLQSEQVVAMVGDGTNDAPALAEADFGIAMGSGTAAASDAADIAVSDNDLSSVVTAFTLANAARRRLLQNSVLALLYNAIAIPLAVVGLLNPLLAMGALVTSAVLVAGNSFRGLLNG